MTRFTLAAVDTLGRCPGGTKRRDAVVPTEAVWRSPVAWAIGAIRRQLRSRWRAAPDTLPTPQDDRGATNDLDRLLVGADVSCRDGVWGTLGRVIVDPRENVLTHLVIEPRHPDAGGRLIPVALVASIMPTTIRLACSIGELELLPTAKQIDLLPDSNGGWDSAHGVGACTPYYGLGLGGVGVEGLGWGRRPRAIIQDRVPVGEVQVRRREPVSATDGAIGHVRGLVVLPGDRHVTHVLVDEGHAWRHKRVAVPIGAVTLIDDRVQLALSKRELRDLPSVDSEAGQASCPS